MRTRSFSGKGGAKTYEECVSDDPGRSGGSENEKGTNTLIVGRRRHCKVCRTDVPGPSTEGEGDIYIGTAS